MAVYKRDMVDINLETGNIHRSFLKHSIGYKDAAADHFGIRAFRNGEPVNLTGVSIQGIFMPPQGPPIAITSGNIVIGNEAEVVLPQACYNYDGQFTLAIKLVDPSNAVTGTIRIVDGMVDNTHASGTVAPTAAVPGYEEVLATYEQAIAAINKTVRFDATQSLTDTQKATARSNISAPSVAEMNTAVGNEATARQNADALKVNISDIENDLTGTTAGKVLDARQGKVLDDKITAEAATRAAADSDLKSAFNIGNGSIVSDLKQLTDAEIAIFKPGYYKTVAAGSAVEYIETNTAYVTTLIPVTEGDKITLDAYGYTANSRLYVFIDGDGNALNRCDERLSGKRVIKAPANAVYCAINNRLASKGSGYYAYKGKAVKDSFISENNVLLRFYNGSINTSTGAASPSDTRIRTLFYYAPYGVSFTLPEGYKAQLFYYSGNTVDTFIDGLHEWFTGTVIDTNPLGNYVRIVIAYSDDSDISTYTMDVPVIASFGRLTDGSLTEENKSADAKAVGDEVYSEKNLASNTWEWKNGTIIEDGTSRSSTIKVRSQGYVKIRGLLKIKIPEGYKIRIYAFSAPQAASLISISGFLTGTVTIKMDETAYYRFVIGATDDSDISPSVASGFVFTSYCGDIFLGSTCDSTDRTNEINAFVRAYGKLKLGNGIFVTTGITLSENNTLEGQGTGTIIFLSGDSDANAITMNSFCTVKNMQIQGRETDYVYDDSTDPDFLPTTPGGRNGIYFADSIEKGFVEDCYIHGFSGGAITAYNTGTGSASGMLIKSCYLLLNCAGIYLKEETEFHVIENCTIRTNYYGIIDHGANNMFDGDNVSSNYYGFYHNFSDKSGSLGNHMHGSIHSCEFKHIRNRAIYINTSSSRFLLTGCDFGSSESQPGGIELISAGSLMFSDCIASDHFPVYITNGGITVFANWIFLSPRGEMIVTNNDKVKFVNCFGYDGSIVDPTQD